MLAHPLEIFDVLQEIRHVRPRAARPAVAALIVQDDVIADVVHKSRKRAVALRVIIQAMDDDDGSLGCRAAKKMHVERRPVCRFYRAIFFRCHRLSVLLAALTIAVLAGCTPYRHAAVFYEKTPAELADLERHAEKQCAAVRADDRRPPHAFTTDGCSVWPDRDWRGCCVEHDMSYWCGGSAAARATADSALRSCLAQMGHPRTGSFMHLGVRIGGHPWLPFPWRWGYGWDWPYQYDAE
jgi:hypothetical protein